MELLIKILIKYFENEQIDYVQLLTMKRLICSFKGTAFEEI